MRRQSTVGRIISTALLSLVALIFVVPLIWTVLTALKPENEVFTTGLRPFGSHVQWSNFRAAWTQIPFGRFIINSLIVAGLGTLLNVIVSVLSGYAFARLSFRIRDRLFLVFLATMVLPSEALVVPMFIGFHKLGLTDSYTAMILPAAFSPFGTFLLRQFILSLPTELEDAARIDGAGLAQVLVSIVVPLVRPAIMVLASFTFIAYWGAYLWPLIVTNDQSLATVPLGLAMFTGQYGTQWSLLMAACAITIVPSLILLLIVQRHLVKGLAAGGFGGR